MTCSEQDYGTGGVREAPDGAGPKTAGPPAVCADCSGEMGSRSSS